MCHRCVADMSQIRPESKCLQYADDTTLYRACKASQRHACINNIEKDIHSILRWSSDTNLIFNSAKTKVMVISTSQMSNITNLKKKKKRKMQQYHSRKSLRMEIIWYFT